MNYLTMLLISEIYSFYNKNPTLGIWTPDFYLGHYAGGLWIGHILLWALITSVELSAVPKRIRIIYVLVTNTDFWAPSQVH